MKNSCSKIKICFVIDTLTTGGAGKLTLDLIKQLNKDKFEVTLIYFTKSEINSENLNYKKLDSTRIIHLNLFDFFFIKRCWLLYKLLKGQHIVHSCLEMSNFYCSLVSIITPKIKFVSTIHGIDGIFIDDVEVQEMFRKNLGLKYKLMIKYIQSYTFKFYDSFIAVSIDTKNFLINKRRIPESKINVVYHGISLSEFSENNKIASCIRKQMGIKEKDFLLGYLGRITNGKGLEYLIDSFAELYENQKNLKLILIGDGNLYNFLQAKVSSLGLSSSIIFKESVTNVDDYYSMIDLFILPSFSEGIPLTLLEAMYLKRVVLSSDVGGVSEVVNHSNGFTFKKGDFIEMQQKIKYIYTNFDQLDIIKDNAHCTVINRFDFSKNCQIIFRIFNKLVAVF